MRMTPALRFPTDLYVSAQHPFVPRATPDAASDVNQFPGTLPGELKIAHPKGWPLVPNKNALGSLYGRRFPCAEGGDVVEREQDLIANGRVAVALNLCACPTRAVVRRMRLPIRRIGNNHIDSTQRRQYLPAVAQKQLDPPIMQGDAFAHRHTPAMNNARGRVMRLLAAGAFVRLARQPPARTSRRDGRGTEAEGSRVRRSGDARPAPDAGRSTGVRYDQVPAQ